jgi:hypothetical protein
MAAQPAREVVHEGGRWVLHRRQVDVFGVLHRAHWISNQENRRSRTGQWWATDRSARHRSTSARSNFRTAACRPAGSALHPWPASRLRRGQYVGHRTRLAEFFVAAR